LGRGTTFTLVFPTTERPLVSTLVEEAEPASGGREAVLLVEDEAGVRRVMAQALRHGGYEVFEAAGADDALWLARAKRIDLLLTDVVMPGLDGRAVAARVQALHPDVPVLYVSGYTAEVLSERGVLPSDAHLLEKPFSTDQLLARVRQRLDRVAEAMPVGLAS
jgi:DNA-binding response OmpR family regulator